MKAAYTLSQPLSGGRMVALTVGAVLLSFNRVLPPVIRHASWRLRNVSDSTLYNRERAMTEVAKGRCDSSLADKILCPSGYMIRHEAGQNDLNLSCPCVDEVLVTET